MRLEYVSLIPSNNIRFNYVVFRLFHKNERKMKQARAEISLKTKTNVRTVRMSEPKTSSQMAIKHIQREVTHVPFMCCNDRIDQRSEL